MTYSQVKNYLLSFIYNNPSSKIRGQVVQTAIQGSLDTTVGFSCIRFPKGTLTTNDIGKIVGNNNGVAALPRIINRYVGSPNSTVGQCEYPLLGQLVDIDGSDAIISGSAQFATKLSPESVPVSFAQTSPPSDANDYPYRVLCVNEDGWLIAVSTILDPLLFGSDIPNNWSLDSVLNQFYIAITAAAPGDPIVVQQCFGTPIIPLAANSSGGGNLTPHEIIYGEDSGGGTASDPGFTRNPDNGGETNMGAVFSGNSVSVQLTDVISELSGGMTTGYGAGMIGTDNSTSLGFVGVVDGSNLSLGQNAVLQLYTPSTTIFGNTVSSDILLCGDGGGGAQVLIQAHNITDAQQIKLGVGGSNFGSSPDDWTTIYGLQTTSGGTVVLGVINGGNGTTLTVNDNTETLDFNKANVIINNQAYIWPGSQASGTLVNDGSGNLSWGGGVITTVTVNVTSSQILNSFTSPVTLLPAPGNGLQWNVLSYQGYYTFGSSPYTATGFIGLMQGDVNNIIDGYLDIFNTILLNAPNSTQFKGAVGSNNYSVNSISLYNQPVQFYSDTANPTGGDGSFSITIIAVLTS